MESLLHTASGHRASGADAALAAREARRSVARLLPDAVVADRANEPALLLGGPLPPDPLLPLADLYASEVAVLARTSTREP